MKEIFIFLSFHREQNDREISHIFERNPHKKSYHFFWTDRKHQPQQCILSKLDARLSNAAHFLQRFEIWSANRRSSVEFSSKMIGNFTTFLNESPWAKKKLPYRLLLRTTEPQSVYPTFFWTKPRKTCYSMPAFKRRTHFCKDLIWSANRKIFTSFHPKW